MTARRANSRELEKAIDRALQPLLARYGFHRQRERHFTIELGEGCSGAVALSTSCYAGQGCLALPYLWVVDHEVERLVAQFRGERLALHKTATIVVTLKNATHKGDDEWEFHYGVDPVPRAKALAEAIGNDAVPFMRRLSSRDDVLRWFPHASNFNKEPYRVPVILLLLGRTEEASSYVDKVVARNAHLPNIGFQAEYRVFAAAFHAYVDGGRRGAGSIS